MPVVGIIPGLIPPPQNGVPLIGREVKKPEDLCTASWDHTGPGFEASLAKGCAAGGGGGSMLGELSESSSLEALILELAEDEFEERLEEEREIDSCNRETFVNALDDDLKEDDESWWNDLPGRTQTKLWTTYCTLKIAPEDHRGQFVDFINRDDSVGEDWREVITSARVTGFEIEDTLEYLMDDGGKWERSILKKHEVTGFETAAVANPPTPNPANATVHNEPGIVTTIETNEDWDVFARVYSKNAKRSSGWYLGRGKHVRNKSRKVLIQNFALWDEGIFDMSAMDPHWRRIVSSRDWEDDVEPWGDYHCLAKVFVPKDTTLRISDTSEFEADDPRWPLTESLRGHTLQFEVGEGTDHPLFRELWRWVPLGKIDALSENPETFDERWDSVTKADAESGSLGYEVAKECRPNRGPYGD